MIRRILSCTAVFVAGSAMVAVAAPKDDVSAAAQKLADAPNYSWKSTTEMAGGGGGGGGRGFGGPSEGKTEKGGFTHVSMVRGDNTIEVVRKGDKGAVKTQDGWQTFAELQSAEADGGGQGGGQGRGRMMGRMIRNFKAPAQEAADLASKSKEITKSGDAYQADLTEDGVKEMLSLGRRPGQGDGNAPPAPTNTKGTVKFWMKDGALAKYEYNVKGTMSFQGQDREIDRTTTVEIKDVGSTKVEVPSDAKGKVS